MTGQEVETFTKRKGCTDRGKDYEHLYLCSVILKLVADNTVTNFQITSNDNDFGVFDDVTIDVLYTNGTRRFYAIQLKHVNQSKTLTKKGIAEKSGHFAVKKYFEDYSKLTQLPQAVTLALFTNLKFDVPNGVGLTLAEDDFEVKLGEGPQEELLKTGDRGRCRKFVGDGTKYEKFFGGFVLYTGQAGVDKLREDVKVAFLNMFKCEVVGFDRYVQFVTEWSLKEGKKIKLNKNFMIRAIVVRVVDPYLTPLTFSGGGSTENGTIWREVLAEFPVTEVDVVHREKIVTRWSDLKRNLDLDEANKVSRMYQITPYIANIDDLNDKDCTKLLWLMGPCPLPVVANEVVTKVIDLCAHTFLVFGTANTTKKTFLKLADLDPSSHSKITTHFKCSLQGKEDLTLESIFNDNPNLEPLFTTSQLVQMLDDSLKIGGKKETLPIPHIDRVLSRTLIKTTFLNSQRNSLIIINSVTPSYEQIIKSSSLGCTVTRVTDLSTRQLEDSEVEKNQIVVSSGELSKSEINDYICSRFKTKQYHLFRADNDVMEWVRSTADITELKEHQIADLWMEQNVLFSTPLDNSVNIVVADPGMGKSILMKTLKNSSKRWTVLLQPKDHSRYFREKNNNVDAFLAYVIDKTYKDNFDRKFVKVLLGNKQVDFIWDGLDEVQEANLKVIFQIISQLSKRGFTQWLTSRCNLTKTLESEFNVLARTIGQFDAQQQNTYIEKRLNCTGSALHDIKTKIRKCIRLVQYNDILGIPLQIYMFTELFRQDPDKYRTLLESIFSITDLYRHFVDEKFNIYQGKANLDGSNDVMVKLMERNKCERLKRYEEAALKTYFRPEIIEVLRVDCDAFLEEIQSGCDGVGIITGVTDELVPSFLHNSYGEYFAASFLSKYHRKVPNFANFIFEESYNNIRFLFDLLMAEECPAHVAVLYKNPLVLEEHEGDLRRRDKGGRNPLHLACSWGRRFAIRSSPKDDGTDVTTNETSEYQHILAFLTTRCDPLESDQLFQMNSFAYADTAFCLVPILVLSNTHKFDLATLKNFSDMKTILYTSVKLDYADVFEDIPFTRLDSGTSLLHLAVGHGSINSLKKILKNREYHQVIDSTNSKGLTPFLLACHRGDVEILKVLMAAGADVTATSQQGYGGIYLAARSSHQEAIEFLVASGLDINSRNQFGKSALHLACENGLSSPVDLLVKYGAEVNFGDDYGFTPLYLACRHKHKEIVEFLLRKNADVNRPNHHGDVPLFMAAWSDQTDVMRMFMDAGADVDAANKRGHGPIHAACLNRSLDALKLLISNKADVNAPNKFGQTPLHLAVRHKFDEGIVVLLDAGADIFVVNRHGETFCDMGDRYYRGGVRRFVVEARGGQYWEAVKDKVYAVPVQMEKACYEKSTRCNIS